jgi:hypothetical protein
MTNGDGETSEIAGLRNLGKVSERWLNGIGIRTEAELRGLGAVNAYRVLSLRGYRPTLNLVWAIEGALRGVVWTDLPAEVRASLEEELERPWDPTPFLADGD